MPDDVSTPTPPAAADEAVAGGDVELGWVVVGRLDGPDRAAVREAHGRVLARLEDRFDAFTWRAPLLERSDLPTLLREEPVVLLQLGLEERDARHWDWVIVITGSDLEAHTKPFALGAPSRALGVAVVSTARIDPQAQGVPTSDEQRTQTLARRLESLVLHLIGHLAGLRRDAGVMRAIEDVGDLDRAVELTDADVEALREELREVADLRVEEDRGPSTRRLPFSLRSAWVNREAIASAVVRARPWRFPIQSSKLTTAAVSALLVLVNTAEVWELALSLRPAALVGLSVAALGATTAYVVGRQRLLAQRARRRTEQAVATKLSLSIIVALGLSTTYVAVFVTTWVGALLFPDRVVASWSGLEAAMIHPLDLGRLAAFVASLGMVIGALGASFEAEHYFRHMVYVDDEI